MDQGQHINTTVQPLLILGKRGTLAGAFARICRSRNIYHIVLGRPEIDICNDLTDILEQYSPWAVINATGYVNVDGAEEDSDSCERINSHAVHQLARACAASNIRLVNFSSDLVFDGHKGQPYFETDGTRPLNVYGKSKGLAEMYLRAVYPGALTIRTSAFFGAWDNYNFIHTTLQSLLNNEKTFAATDMIVSPTYVPHLVHAALDLLIDDECGIWHLANKGAISW
ncbi:MAG: SDR family oxidoreductase, partial [Sphingobacteriales bacterium]